MERRLYRPEDPLKSPYLRFGIVVLVVGAVLVAIGLSIPSAFVMSVSAGSVLATIGVSFIVGYFADRWENG